MARCCIRRQGRHRGASSGDAGEPLDLWFHREVKPRCRGEACLIRDADDFVCAFQYQEDAERFYLESGQRLRKFGLELSEKKTRVIPFSREQDLGKTDFDFLGFEFRWGRDRRGRPHLKQRTLRKRLRDSLKRFTEWCKVKCCSATELQLSRIPGAAEGIPGRATAHRGEAEDETGSFGGVGRMRERVFLKSPVRENRTLVSVRGRLGNWPSYRHTSSESMLSEAFYAHLRPFTLEAFNIFSIPVTRQVRRTPGE
ncbi:MAG: hypothetical protein ACUVWZ_15035 [Anaerolineae bacterium]